MRVCIPTTKGLLLQVLKCVVCGSSLAALHKRRVLVECRGSSSASLAAKVERLLISPRGLSLAVLSPVSNRRVTAKLLVARGYCLRRCQMPGRRISHHLAQWTQQMKEQHHHWPCCCSLPIKTRR